ncbi:MAG: thymidine phosphorylase [Fimbriimonadales bacterium]|nr:thymidine phosphorylase [Fimbriimonadales bacterium]
MTILDILAKRRDGQEHAAEELRFLARGAASGEIPDYQLAAWLMAAYLRPLSRRETADLTLALAESGRRFDLSDLPGPLLDKHSTGGVGDKTSLVLLPLLAACGVTMVKLSGRGLGITGGTLDKIESIPGFRTSLTLEEAKEQARRIGLALCGQTPDLAPADGVLYALRDVTATVGSVPLIVSSILSKKLAGGSPRVLLDVKCGSGAFRRTLPEAEELAVALREVGEQIGLQATPLVTDMDQPLGRAVGNALEVCEALEVLQGAVDNRFGGFCLRLAQRALSLCGLDADLARRAIASGSAWDKALRWIEAQGGDLAALRNGAGLPSAPETAEVPCGAEGWVERVDARTVGAVAMRLGAGRLHKSDRIDPRVGVEVLVEVGDRVETGQPAFRVHAATVADAEKAAGDLREALKVVPSPVPRTPTVLLEP